MERTSNNRVVHTAEELANNLKKGYVASSGQCKACCPSHPDTNPSLSIKDGINGNILLHCHSGCSYESIVNALNVQGISLNNRARFEKYQGLPEGIFYKFEGKDYVSHYTYRNEKGNTVGFMVRYESASGEKSFIPYFKKEAEKWKPGYSGKGNSKRPLYNLDAIYRRPEEIIWIAEGEKCADALSKLGFLATTSPGGANGATKADWQPLANRHCIMWPDNDPPGKLYSLNVFHELNNICESSFGFEQIDISKIDSLENKEDAYDFIRKGNGKLDIQALPMIQINDVSDVGVIEIDPAKTFEAMDKAEALLLKKNPYVIFQKSETICRITNSDSGDCYIKPLHRNDFITDLLNRQFQFVRITKTGIVPTDVPQKMVDHYFARAGYWKLHTLNGLILSPTLRADGSVLDTPGYDKKTKLYYVPKGSRFNPLCELPVDNNPEELRSIAVTQLQRLADLFEDFPFVSEADKSTVLAAIFTALTRKNYINAPAFGFNATVQGSGKTLLANIIHIIATGEMVTPMNLNNNIEEADKAIFAKLIEGRPIILLDNITGAVKSGQFCEIITSSSGKHTGRILGLSEMKTVSTDITFLLTGNNLTFAGDMTRRVLMCSLDPKVEKPENRTGFVFPNLPEYVMKRRESYIKAALTVMKCYQLAGKPKQDIENWGGFENWSSWVRSPLVWCGFPDPYLTQTQIEDNDPERNSIKTIFRLWYNIYEEDPMKLNEIIADCNLALENKTPSAEYDLANELMEIGGRGKTLDNNRIGFWFRNKRDRIMDGLKLVCTKQKTNVRKWRIIKIE
jgi:putative DNA primase/helicase